MASELRVDRIVPTTGVPTGGGGGIVQMVQTVMTDGVTYTNTSFADIPSPGPVSYTHLTLPTKLEV